MGMAGDGLVAVVVGKRVVRGIARARGPESG